MNFKRGKPKNARGGCLMCHFWKMNGYGKLRLESEKFSDHKRRVFSIMDIEQYRLVEEQLWDKLGI